ncbi:MAG: hypothetical protein M5R36_26145 [Deltaproteobacteria bacterium]|nr:hypothetical protein [Deltaproteobacteria bacterium]
MKEVEKQLADFRASFESPEAYHTFLKNYQLVDPTVEMEPDPDLRAFGNIEYLFRVRAIVRLFVDKKLNLLVRLALDNAVATRGEALRAENPGLTGDELRARVEADLTREKLIEWVQELAARAKITMHDESYRAGLERFLALTSGKAAVVE